MDAVSGRKKINTKLESWLKIKYETKIREVFFKVYINLLEPQTKRLVLGEVCSIPCDHLRLRTSALFLELSTCELCSVLYYVVEWMKYNMLEQKQDKTELILVVKLGEIARYQ